MSTSSMTVGRNVATLLDRTAHSRPNDVAIEGGEILTYSALTTLTKRVGSALRGLGCVRGDRVLVVLPDCVDAIAIVFGCARIGAVAVPVTPFGTADDIGHFLRDINPRLVVTDAERLPMLRAADGGNEQRILIASGGATGDHMTLRGLAAASTPDLEAVPVRDGTPIVLLYTSGSTGRPRAAIHSHGTVRQAVRNVGKRVFGIGPGDVVLSVPKLSFAFGLGFGVLFPLAAGARVILNPAKPSLDDVFGLIAAYRPTILVAVPTFLAAMLKCSGDLEQKLASVRFVASAGEPLPREVFTEFRKRHLEIVEGLGSTELLTHIISNRKGEARADRCGTAVPGCDLRLLTDDGRPAAIGEIGTLWVRSRTLFGGYWNHESSVRPRGRDQWFNTGDQLYRDAAGYYAYCGRADDMVKVSGLWASSRDIAASLCTHPGIAHAAVTARRDPSGLRKLVAFVVPMDARCPPKVADLVRHVGATFPVHMIPTAFVTLEKLPLTVNGKLSRCELPEPRWPVPGTVCRNNTTEK